MTGGLLSHHVDALIFLDEKENLNVNRCYNKRNLTRGLESLLQAQSLQQRQNVDHLCSVGQGCSTIFKILVLYCALRNSRKNQTRVVRVQVKY